MNNFLSLRVITLETDKLDHQPVYERVLALARRRGLAGATASRGIAGFGQSQRLHSAKIVQLSMDLPVVVEVIDRADKIRAFKAELDQLLQKGVTTCQPVEATIHSAPPVDEPPPGA